MCDCEDLSDFTDDQERPTLSDNKGKLKKLNVTNYKNEKYLEDAIFLIDFDESK